MHTFRLAASATSNGEGSPKTPTPVDDSGAHHDLANGDDSSIFTLQPYAPSAKGKLNSATSSFKNTKKPVYSYSTNPDRRFSSSTSQHFKMFPPFASSEG